MLSPRNNLKKHPEFPKHVTFGMWIQKSVKYSEKVIQHFKLPVEHGDIVFWLTNNGYRNHQLMFWSEVNGIVFPCYDFDDYGSVPLEFRVGDKDCEFSPEHWIDYADHNSIVAASDEIVKKLQTSKGTFEYIRIQGIVYTFKIDKKHPTMVNFHVNPRTKVIYQGMLQPF